jgi:hypothetical protein
MLALRPSTSRPALRSQSELFTAGAAVTVGAGARTGLVTCGAIYISGANAVIQSIVAKAGGVALGAGTKVIGTVTTNTPITLGAGAVVLGSH